MSFVFLGDVTNCLDQRRKPLNDQERSLIRGEGKYPYVGANNVLDYVDEYLFDEEILLLAEDGGSWGHKQKCSFILNEKCWVNNHAHVLTAKENLYLKFLMYYLNFHDLNKYVTGTTRGKLTRGALNRIKIPLPPLPIQKKIAEVLDAADQIRQRNKEILAKYDQLTQSVFLEMFGGIIIKNKLFNTELNEACNFIDYRGKTPERVDSGIPLISAKCVRPGWFDEKRIDYISESTYEKIMSRGFPKEGDILFTTEGHTMGYTCQIPIGYKKFAVGQRIITLQAKEEYSNTFLNFFLNTGAFQNEVKKYATGSAAQGIRSARLKKIMIPKPAKKDQEDFALKIKKIEQQKSLVHQELEKSEELFQSLLQRAFKDGSEFRELFESDRKEVEV